MTAPRRRLGGRLLLAAVLLLPAMAGPGAEPAAQPGAEPPKTGYEAFLEKGRIRDFPERPWEQAFVFNAGRYTVRTDTAQEVAEYVGVLMDAVHFHYCARFGVQGTSRAGINVFRDKKEMDAFAAKRYKYSPVASCNGFFTTADGGAICLFWQEFCGQRPETVLMHEGTHHFVNAVFRDALPIWLNEGFAVYFENSRFDGRNLDMGRVPVGRLKQLQAQMRQDKHVGLEKLFATAQKDFGVDHYGAAWAFVFWLAHGGSTRELAVHQQALGQFVVDCRANRKDGKALVGYLGRPSLAALEKEWKGWVLELDSEDPYGGARPPDPAKADEASRAVLRRLSDYYAGLRSARVGFAVEEGGGSAPAAAGSLAFRRPNLLAARIPEGRGETALSCDGKTLTAAAPGSEPRQSKADPTLQAALGRLSPAGGALAAAGLGPLAALLRDSPQDELLRGADSVRSLGAGDVGGTACQRLKFAGRGGDLELWIAEGAKPLLVKAVVELRAAKGQARTLTVTFKDWETNPDLPDKAFAAPGAK